MTSQAQELLAREIFNQFAAGDKTRTAIVAFQEAVETGSPFEDYLIRRAKLAMLACLAARAQSSAEPERK